MKFDGTYQKFVTLQTNQANQNSMLAIIQILLLKGSKIDGIGRIIYFKKPQDPNQKMIFQGVYDGEIVNAQSNGQGRFVSSDALQRGNFRQGVYRDGPIKLFN